MRNLVEILTQFHKIVSPESCNDLAKKSQFVQRSTSQILGYEFAAAMMIPNAFLEAETLISITTRMRSINKNCDISASALAQRINTLGAKSFLKACLGLVIKNVLDKDFASLEDLSNLACFNRVLIQDSTRAELHEKLSSDFKGSGGVASTASLKIDYIFDYLTEQIVDIEFFGGNKPDQSLANRVMTMLEKNDLIIRDLGYFVINSLRKIEEAGAYFITRWKVNEDVYENAEAKEPLDLARFLEKQAIAGMVDTQVFIGKERRPVRLVACRVNEIAYNKRLREANKGAKRHGSKISEKKKNLLKYTIFITNVPVTMLTTESIIAIYGARWRIEMIFKQWKSCLKIHMFKGENIERFHCFLYSRLAMIFLLGSLSPPLMRYALELGRELSCYKLTKYLIADHILFKVLLEGSIENFVERLLKDLPRKLCMDKRKRPSLRDNIRKGNTAYNILKITSLQKYAA